VLGPNNSVELRYALRSIDKNFKGDVDIWLYGEKPDWVKDVHFIPMKREPKPVYVKFFDQLRKIELACRNPAIGYRFVYTYDDVYFLKPITMDVLRQPRALEDMSRIKQWFKHTDAGANWVSCMKQTLYRLKDEGLPIYNYETHLPRVYNKEKALAILNKYESRRYAFQFATMYFNNYETNPELLSANKFFKLGIYRPVGYRALLEKAELSEVMNVAKATDDSIRALEVLFPTASRWEKAPSNSP
jgi:hypothetical protein